MDQNPNRQKLDVIQILNAVAMSVVGGIMFIHETNPLLIQSIADQLDPRLGALLIFVFGVVVHYAARKRP